MSRMDPRRGPSGSYIRRARRRWGVGMEDATSKAIPLKRARVIPRRVVIAAPSRWLEALRGAVQLAQAAPRQVWLAALGGVALGVRGVRSGWDRLVTEGAAVEDNFRPQPARQSSPAPAKPAALCRGRRGVRGHLSSAARAAREQRTGPRRRFSIAAGAGRGRAGSHPG